MKKILFIVAKGEGPGNKRKWNSEWPEELENKIDAGSWKIVTPGVLAIAGLTDSLNYNIDLVDEEFQEIDANKNYDIVAFYTVTSNIKRVYKLAAYFKQKGSYIVMGGVHVCVCPDEAAPYADTIIMGEAENNWQLFLKDLKKGKPKRIYKEKVGVFDVNQTSVPRFDLLPENGRRIIPIQTARGCPHGCKFCNLRSIYGEGYRAKSIDKVTDEVEAALRVNPRAIIYFTDDNLFCYKERAKELVSRLAEYKITWYTNSDLSFGNDDNFLKTIYKSGCRQVLIGFESINAANLNNIDENNFKKHHHSSYKKIIENIQSNGIGIIGSFIIGLEHDKKDIFDDMIKFAYDTHLYGMSITVNTPYPGTIMFDKLKKEDEILTYDWNKYTIFQPVIKTKNMSIEELNKGYIRLLGEVNSPKHNLRKLVYFKEKGKQLLKNYKKAQIKQV